MTTRTGTETGTHAQTAIAGPPQRDRELAKAETTTAPKNGSEARTSFDVVARPILAQQSRTVDVVGGFIRRPVPGDGVLIETEFTTIFLPQAQVEQLLAELAALRGRSA